MRSSLPSLSSPSLLLRPQPAGDAAATTPTSRSPQPPAESEALTQAGFLATVKETRVPSAGWQYDPGVGDGPGDSDGCRRSRRVDNKES